MGRSEEAIEACDELIEKYGSQQEISIVKIALLTRLLRARVLLKLKRKDDAFADVMLFIAHHMFFDELIEQMIDVFVDLAAYGHAEKALELLVGSQAEQHLEPLVAGLRMYCGHESRVANEILEVARDVVKRIEERKLELENKKQ